ncbi:MAG: TPM domain-containing protein [Ginsengibacter sp.]
MTPHELQTYRQSIWDTLPAAVGWVNDFEGLYDKSQEDSIESILEHFERKTTIEIAIVTVDSNMVAPNKFDEFAYRLMKIWGIGKIEKSNGIVICICKDYHKLFISTDFGIDKYMDQTDKSRIITKNIIPFFQKNNYFSGTLNGLNAILDKINKKWDKYNKT